MLGVSAHRALSFGIKNSVAMIAFPPLTPGAIGGRAVSLTSSVPALVKLSEKPLEEKDKDGKDIPVTLTVGGEGVLYLPPNVPVAVASGQRHIYVRSLDKDGIFCAAPMASI